MKIRLSLFGIPMVLCACVAVASAQQAAPATQPLTKTVGVDIVQKTANPDKTFTLLFRWKDKDGKDVERPVIINPDTIIGIRGELKTMADLTDDVMHKNKAVATCGPDNVTAVSLRVGREMIKLDLDRLTPGQRKSVDLAGVPATAASDAALAQRINEMVDALALNDSAKAGRVKAVITTHLKNVRDTHNAGFAPADSSRATFNAGLAAELTPAQIDTIKDRITVNKVSFTYNAYQQIVPGLTATENAFILDHLKQAREESLDLKNPDEMSRVFEKYKTQIENYLTANGHDWKTLYKAFTDAQKAAKANGPATKPVGTN